MMLTTTNLLFIVGFCLFNLNMGIPVKVGPESSTVIPVGRRIKAMWQGTTIAESTKAVKFDNNIYFPPDSLYKQYFENSSTQSTCPWKGVASYMSIVVNGERYLDAVWYYPMPKEPAKEITGYYGFLSGVQLVQDN